MGWVFVNMVLPVAVPMLFNAVGGNAGFSAAGGSQTQQNFTAGKRWAIGLGGAGIFGILFV